MKLADMSHAFGSKKTHLVLDREDPVIAHAINECCTYVCDVMHKLGIRSYDAHTARNIAREMLDPELSASQKWERYLNETAPQMEDQLLMIILGKQDKEY